MKLFSSVGLIVVLVALALSAAAFAGNDPAECTYYPEKCKKVAATTGATTTPAAAVATAGATGLPFTGTDVTYLLVGGVAFGLIGFGMRRSGRNKSS